MSLGWGLRGYIGGGPLGAMIPGAMVAMALCVLLRRSPESTALTAAFGAIGVAFGGQMTYGQTIGLTVVPATAAWGLLGLTLKGAIWGLLGGTVIGTGFVAARRWKLVGLASAVLTLACWIGWKLVNEPKLIYFSDPVNKPRAEIWAGLLLAAIGFLLVIRNRTAWTFAWIATIGGGAGFGFGGWLNALGRTSGLQSPVDWWKVMEFTFGFLFGASLGLAAWLRRGEVEDDHPVEHSSWLWLALLPLLPLGIAVEEGLVRGRFPYTVVGACLLPLAAAVNSRFAWQIAVTMTCAAFGVDFLQSRPTWDQPLLWTSVIVFAILIGWLVDRTRSNVAQMLVLLSWVAVGDSYLKAWLPPFQWDPAKSWPHANVEIMFTLLACSMSWMLLRHQQQYQQ
jgi:hypothetical protein